MTRPALVPELYVSNLETSLDFYTRLLGFEMEYQRPEEGFATLRQSGAYLMLEETSSNEAATESDFEQGQWRTARLEKPFGRGINLEITLPDIEPIHARLIAAGYPLTLGMREKWYRVGEKWEGVRQFLVQDPDGYLLRFAQEIGTRLIELPR